MTPLNSIIADVQDWAAADEVRLAEMLVEAGQAHLFAGWQVGADVDKKHAFFEQVSVCSTPPRAPARGHRSSFVNRRAAKLVITSAPAGSCAGGKLPGRRDHVLQ